MKLRPMAVLGKAPAIFVPVFLIVLTGLAATALAAEAAHHADSSAQLKDFGYRLLSFAILAAILAWGAKKANIKGLLATRQAAVAKALQEAAERIREQAKVYAQQEVQMAKARLRAETSRLAVRLAEESLRRSVTPADQERFVDEYLNKVVEAN